MVQLQNGHVVTCASSTIMAQMATAASGSGSPPTEGPSFEYDRAPTSVQSYAEAFYTVEASRTLHEIATHFRRPISSMACLADANVDRRNDPELRAIWAVAQFGLRSVLMPDYYSPHGGSCPGCGTNTDHLCKRCGRR